MIGRDFFIETIVMAIGFLPQVAEERASGPVRTLKVEQAVRIAYLTDLQFSPDGSKLAFVVEGPPTGREWPTDVHLLDVSTRVVTRFTTSPNSDSHPRWSPDGKSLAFLSDRSGPTTIHVIPAGGGEATKLLDSKHVISTFEWSPDGRSIAFLASEPKPVTEKQSPGGGDKEGATKETDPLVIDASRDFPRIWITNVDDRSVRGITEPSWRIKEFRWSAGGDFLYVIASDRPETEGWTERILAVPIEAGELREVAAPSGPFGSLSVSPDGKGIAFLASRQDGPSEHDLFLVDTKTGDLRNLTAVSLDRPVAGFEWTAESGFAALIEDGFRTPFVRLDREGKVVAREDGWPVQPIRMTRSKNGTLAFVGENATSPSELWLVPPGGQPERVTQVQKDFTGVRLIEPEIRRYRGPDGREIEAAFYRPHDAPPNSKPPLVVYVHGGPTDRWADWFYFRIQVLAARGFAVLLPNVRGSSGYGWDWLAANRGDWGGGDFRDVLAGVDDLAAAGKIDPDRVGIAGWSYGGYMAAWAITQTDRFKAAIVGAGMSDLSSLFGTESVGVSNYDRWFLGVPYENPESYRKSSPITFVSKAKTPTLILHGENDPVTPQSQAKQLHRALKHYGVETELVVYPREGHGIREEKHLIDQIDRMAKWFEKHLQTDARNR